MKHSVSVFAPITPGESTSEGVRWCILNPLPSHAVPLADTPVATEDPTTTSSAALVAPCPQYPAPPRVDDPPAGAQAPAPACRADVMADVRCASPGLELLLDAVGMTDAMTPTPIQTVPSSSETRPPTEAHVSQASPTDARVIGKASPVQVLSSDPHPADGATYRPA